MPSTGNIPQVLIELDQRFGRGKVVRVGLRKGPRNRLAAELLCDCGATYSAQLIHLRAGLVVSCGCQRREKCAAQGRKGRIHGLSDHPLYSTWVNVLDRCENPANHSYRNYGGRGIRVWEPWREDPTPFIDWIEQNLGPRPSPEHSINRIDNDGNYEPGNLDWASPLTQVQNSRQRHDPITGRFLAALPTTGA
jgi:hypothetical protein